MTRGKILLIEDNADEEFLAMEAFDLAGLSHYVSVLRDGQQAIEYLDRIDVPIPEVIILDLKIPKIEGLDVLSRIRATPRTSEVPVVVFTSSRLDQDLEESYRRGANSYVQKPIEFESFSRAIRLIGEYWLHWNECSARRKEMAWSRELSNS